MEREIAIKIQGLKKMYKLGQIGGGTLRGDLTSWWARVRGKEDPNSKIGTDARSYGQTFMAINGIDLTIYKGEAIGIIGGNGAGKSTTLKILSRITAPTEGKVDIYGRIASMLEVGTGFNGELTGRENIYMNGAILGMSKAEVDAKMEEIIDFSECREFIDTPVKRYSSGMYVKLAFSVAAHLDSEIMIMDEVLAVGDMAFQKKCLNKMRDAATLEGRTVLYVSHNMNTIRQLCERCVVLDKGKIIFDGDVERAISVYMGSMGNNSISYDYRNLKRKHPGNYNVELMGLDFLNRKTNKILRKESFSVCLHCKVNADAEELKFRFEIVKADGNLVGSCMTNKPISVKKNTNVDVVMNVNTKNFAVGEYYIIALSYESDEQGNQIHYDRVEPAAFFEILQRDDEINWLSKWWGNTFFDDIEVDDVIVNKEEI